MRKKLFLLFFALSLFIRPDLKALPFAEAKSQKNPASLSKKRPANSSPQRKTALSSALKAKKIPPFFNNQESQAKGVILAFKKWPLSQSEKELILQKTKEAALTASAEYEIFKSWVFEWDKEKKAVLAEDFCKNLPKLAFLDYCEPDDLLNPAREQKASLPPPPPDPRIPPSAAEHIGYFKPPLIPPIADLRSCGIVSTKLNLIAGKLNSPLPDYWAQEMIGADLLKEELKKTPRPNKRLVSVFDGPNRNHYIGVKNLISDKGKHAVLPEMGSGINYVRTDRISKTLRAINSLLMQARKKCGLKEPKEPKEYEQQKGQHDE